MVSFSSLQLPRGAIIQYLGLAALPVTRCGSTFLTFEHHVFGNISYVSSIHFAIHRLFYAIFQPHGFFTPNSCGFISRRGLCTFISPFFSEASLLPVFRAPSPLQVRCSSRTFSFSPWRSCFEASAALGIISSIENWTTKWLDAVIARWLEVPCRRLPHASLLQPGIRCCSRSCSETPHDACLTYLH